MEAFEKTPQEMAEAVSKAQAAIKAEVETKASKEDLNKFNESLEVKVIDLKAQNEALQKKDAEKQEIIEKQGEAITRLEQKGVEVAENVSIRKQIETQLKQKSEDLKSLKESGSKANVQLTVKAAAPITFGNVTGEVPQSDREAGITRIVRRQPWIADLVDNGTISSNLWSWVEQKNPDGDAGMTGEGEAKSQADFDLVEANAAVKKVTAYIKATTEILEDIPLMTSEINAELVELINLKKDEQILSGDGTGNNLTGILTNATAFAAGSFALAVENANRYDVLRIAINQIMVAQFVPNWIALHPSDATSMDLEKGSDGHYVMPPFTTAEGNVIKGVPIIMNTGITEGEFLVGDFSKSGVRLKKDLTINVGFENDDFTKNFVTILGECRLVHRVKSNHYGAFVTGDFATAIAAILKP